MMKTGNGRKATAAILAAGFMKGYGSGWRRADLNRTSARDTEPWDIWSTLRRRSGRRWGIIRWKSLFPSKYGPGIGGKKDEGHIFSQRMGYNTPQ